MFMTFKEWKKWIGEIHWSLRWFIFLILVRPIVDNFYYLKDISPLLSPLYIIGVITPVLAIYSIVHVKKPNYSRLDFYFGFMAVLGSFSCIVLAVSDAFAFDSLDFAFKFMLPFLLYFFCRRLIRSKKDLQGVFQTFSYSIIFVVLIFTYELIFGPINIQISRGLERFQGSYADVMNYAVYTSCGLLITFYSFIEKPKSVSHRTRIILLTFAIVYTVLILFNIHHTASYAVVAALSILFVFTITRANLGVGILVISISALVFYIVGSEMLSEQVTPLIETDIKVYEGEKGNEQLFHGRVGRWMSFLDFFNSKSTIVQFLGLPLGMDHPYSYIAKGSHNDFVRMLMVCGYIGLITYVLILINIGSRIIGHKIAFTFLGLGTLTIVFLYSISLTPLLYATLMYVIMSVYAALALPKNMMD